MKRIRVDIVVFHGTANLQRGGARTQDSCAGQNHQY